MNLKPDTTSGGNVIDVDFESLHVGVATYAEGPTGCTTFFFPQGASFAADIRGGSPGVFLCGQTSGDGRIHALCFTGGSIFGLESVSGVVSGLLQMEQFSTDWTQLPNVAGAVIYDFRPRDNDIFPDMKLGRASLSSARPGKFPIGRIGAGASATVGKLVRPDQWEYAGQGGAFTEIEGVKIGVFTVVNAIGAIHSRSGEIVRGFLDRRTGARTSPTEDLQERIGKLEAETAPSGNTTLSAMITNKKLSPLSLRQIARQTHSSMSRAISPFHSRNDGDVFFAVSTQEIDKPGLTDIDLGCVASELMWDGVLNCFEA